MSLLPALLDLPQVNPSLHHCHAEQLEPTNRLQVFYYKQRKEMKYNIVEEFKQQG